jgi:Fic family protein
MRSWTVHFDPYVDIYNRDVLKLTAQCYALADVINRIPLPPEAQRRIDTLNILRAVRGTTNIEGAELTEEEIQRIADAGPGQQVLPPARAVAEREARNARQLMRFVARLVNEYPNTVLSEKLICKFHEITTGGLDYPGNTPGHYRESPANAGDYIAPRHVEVPGLMRTFTEWFTKGAPAQWDPIIQAVIGHFYVVSIHPFGDGNGRVSRAVESFLLYKNRINARGFYSLANYYYRHRSDYIWYLDHVRLETQEELTPLVLFALRGLVEELYWVRDCVLATVTNIAFRDLAREEIGNSLSPEAAHRVCELVFALQRQPASIRDILQGDHRASQLYRHLTSRTLQRDVRFLRDSRLVITENGKLVANLALMGLYQPPIELLRADSGGHRQRHGASGSSAKST